jgi:hypothetical protein
LQWSMKSSPGLDIARKEVLVSAVSVTSVYFVILVDFTMIGLSLVLSTLLSLRARLFYCFTNLAQTNVIEYSALR